MTSGFPAAQRRAVNRRLGIFDIAIAGSVLTYLAIAPIYWLPGIEPRLLDLVKSSLFGGLLVTAVFAVLSGSRLTRSNIPASLALAAALVLTALIASEPLPIAWGRTRDFIEPLAWLFILLHLPSRIISSVYRLVPLAFVGIAVSVIYAIMARFGIAPDLPVPYSEVTGFDPSQRENMRWVSVSSAGFSFGRTGWAIGTSVALLLGALILWSREKALLGYFFLGVAALGPFMNGARGAALAIIVGGTVFFLTSPMFSKTRTIVVIAGLCGVLTALAFDMSVVVSQRFLITDVYALTDFDALNRLSTGRLATYVHGIEQWMSSPLVGVGIGASTLVSASGENLVIHNVWLRLASEGGILALFGSLLVLFQVRRTFRKPGLPRHLAPVLVTALVASMLEPSVLFGSFNNQAAFWTAVAFAVRGSDITSVEAMRRDRGS